MQIKGYLTTVRIGKNKWQMVFFNKPNKYAVSSFVSKNLFLEINKEDEDKAKFEIFKKRTKISEMFCEITFPEILEDKNIIKSHGILIIIKKIDIIHNER